VRLPSFGSRGFRCRLLTGHTLLVKSRRYIAHAKLPTGVIELIWSWRARSGSWYERRNLSRSFSQQCVLFIFIREKKSIPSLICRERWRKRHRWCIRIHIWVLIGMTPIANCWCGPPCALSVPIQVSREDGWWIICEFPLWKCHRRNKIHAGSCRSRGICRRGGIFSWAKWGVASCCERTFWQFALLIGQLDIDFEWLYRLNILFRLHLWKCSRWMKRVNWLWELWEKLVALLFFCEGWKGGWVVWLFQGTTIKKITQKTCSSNTQ